MVISRGDVFWLTLRGQGSEPSGRRPVVVVQHDRFNHTTLGTVVVAAITSTLRLAALPGNVRLARGEAGLSKACVVNVTQLVTVEKVRLVERLGSLSQRRQDEIADGLTLLLGADSVLH